MQHQFISHTKPAIAWSFSCLFATDWEQSCAEYTHWTSFTEALVAQTQLFSVGAWLINCTDHWQYSDGCLWSSRWTSASETVCCHCVWELLTQLVMVNFHGGVAQRAKDSDDGDFPDGHFTHRLQVLIPLLNIHLVLLTGGRDQLEGGYSVTYRH